MTGEPGATLPDPSSSRAGERDDAEAVACAALAVDGVHDLHPGWWGEVATYLPGRRVTGVRLHERRCEVHLVLAPGASVIATVDAVRDAVRAALAPTASAASAGCVDVVVADVASSRGAP